MKPIRDPKQVEHYGKLLREMMLTEEGRETEFNPEWIRNHGWKVVPVESGWRLPVEYIPRLISLLKGAGYTHCIAVFNQPGYIQNLPVLTRIQPPSDMTTCQLVEVDDADFQEFNRELSPFRAVLTTEDGFWALSTHEWYSLVAGKPATVEAILDEPIERAEQEFLEYASVLAGGQSPDESILQIARHYAAL
jgi:hypothetical protein